MITILVVRVTFYVYNLKFVELLLYESYYSRGYKKLIDVEFTKRFEAAEIECLFFKLQF